MTNNDLIATLASYVTTEALTTKLAEYILKNKIVDNFLATSADTVLSGTMGAELKRLLDVLNTNFTDIGVSFWSTVESINVTAAEWGIGIKKITLPPGKYIIIAHADIPAGDSVGTLSVNDSVVVQRQQSFYASQVTRRVTSAFVENLTKEKTFRVTIWCNATLTATNCEVMAIRIK